MLRGNILWFPKSTLSIHGDRHLSARLNQILKKLGWTWSASKQQDGHELVNILMALITLIKYLLRIWGLSFVYCTENLWLFSILFYQLKIHLLWVPCTIQSRSDGMDGPEAGSEVWLNRREGKKSSATDSTQPSFHDLWGHYVDFATLPKTLPLPA